MMREHLYRAQRVDNKEWIEGFPVFYRANQTGIAQIHPTTRIHQVEGNDYFDITDLFCPKIIPATLCEYTGLTDKGGKKIFAGDIVECVSLANDHHQKGARIVSPVCFWEGAYCLEVTLVALTTDFRVCHTLEVIGTIFDEGD